MLPAAFGPELAANSLVGRWPDRWRSRWYRQLVALGGACTIVALVGANLVGFGIDARGAAAALDALTSAEGVRNLGVALLTLFLGVHLDLEIEAWREEPVAGGPKPVGAAAPD